MSRYDHKIETSLEGIEHLSKEKKEEKEITEKEKIPCEGESVGSNFYEISLAY